MKDKLDQTLFKDLKSLSPLRFFVMIAFILCDAISLAQPFFLGKIIDGLTNGADVKNLTNLFLICFALLAMSFILNYAQNYLWFKMIYKGQMIARSRVFGEVLDQDFNFFKQHSSGDMINRVLNDSAIVAESRLITVPMFILNISTLLMIFFFLFLMEPFLALVVLIFSILYFIYYGFLNKRLRTFQIKERESFSEIFDETGHDLNGAETIRLNNAQNFFLKRFENKVMKHFGFMMNLQKWKTLGTTATNFILDAIPLMVVFIGTFFVVRGKTTVGILFSFYSYISVLNQPINNLASANLTLQSGKATKERVAELISEDEAMGEKVDHIETLEFKDVSFAYNEKSIINELSFSLHKGDRLLIKGRSGSGKTTLLRLMLKELLPTSGEIKINGRDLRDIDNRSLYSRLGILPQDIFIFKATKKENITLGQDYPEDKIKEIMDINFISSITQSNVIDCSGGEKQRVALARAIIKDSDILILDEPTSSVDKTTRDEIIAELGKQCYQEKIVIIVSHDVALKRVCNRILDFEN